MDLSILLLDNYPYSVFLNFFLTFSILSIDDYYLSSSSSNFRSFCNSLRHPLDLPLLFSDFSFQSGNISSHFSECKWIIQTFNRMIKFHLLILSHLFLQSHLSDLHLKYLVSSKYFLVAILLL